MFPFFDFVTALTIAAIVGILLLYITVVYKKGWLKRNSAESYFLCPNPKCRKIFTEPVWLTDLSRTPPEGCPACPHCSINLNTIPFSSVQKSPPPNSMHGAPPSSKEVEKPTQRKQTIKVEMVPKMPIAVGDVSEPTLPADISKGLRRSAVARSKSSVRTLEVEDETLSRLIEKPKVQEEKKASLSSRDCPHFFGYMRSLPKNTPIPDECLGCPRIVECLTHARKVEA